ncbi:motility associated factor glycosyltransferase family protein [Marinicrinis lubricantis]|uniref:Motility associated factor glycosyltransferase family protein n=1 Tax=Marinicrinis lubricantis TaxID=2086470 RepID=A0ABW1ITV8_9BACL
MILTNNEVILKRRFPQVLEQLDNHTSSSNFIVSAQPSKINGAYTAVVEKNASTTYLHSKYDPIHEAEKIIEAYEIDQSSHVLFYGIGLGYHVEQFIQRNPEVEITVIEPHLGVFDTLVRTRDVQFLEHKNIRELIVDDQSDLFIQQIYEWVNLVNGSVVYIPLPSYRRLFSEHYERFEQLFTNLASQKAYNLRATRMMQKPWIMNSLLNMKDILSTPNFLTMDHSVFKGKPAIIVSAGPSLADEIEHLKYIKKNGLAYIFSAGSAIQALIANGIEPDAAFTYDPMKNNKNVFRTVVEKGIQSIPLVFGTSVYHETLPDYPGSKFHMVMQQDQVTPMMTAKSKQELNSVPDAVSIAIIMVHVMQRIGCNPVIFAGQNLGYRNSQFYSTGIGYKGRPDTLTERDRKNVIYTEDVYGNQIETNEGFERMKSELGAVIERYADDMTFINTTKGGAKIERAPFMDMERVIETYLAESGVVDNTWQQCLDRPYRLQTAIDAVVQLAEEIEWLDRMFPLMLKQIDEANAAAAANDQQKVDKLLAKFDHQFMKMKKMKIYLSFLEPMNAAQVEMMVKNLERFQTVEDYFKRAEKIISEFKAFICKCFDDYEELRPVLMILRSRLG